MIPVIIFGLYSCSAYFSEAVIPHYVVIKDLSVTTNYGTQGSPVSDIKECWVYADGKLLGAFDRNKLIPIISDMDEIELTLVAGIRANGNNSTVVQYFLMEPKVLNIANTPNKTDSIDVAFSYNNSSSFLFFEGFEGTNIFTKDIDGNDLTKIITTTSDSNTGSACGKITLNSEADEIEVTSSLDFYQISNAGNQIFLELSYKGNNDFIIGLTGKDNSTGKEYSTDVIYIKSKDNWNRMYIDLTSSVQVSDLDAYKVFLYAKFNGKEINTEILLDDIKFLYLKS